MIADRILMRVIQDRGVDLGSLPMSRQDAPTLRLDAVQMGLSQIPEEASVDWDSVRGALSVRHIDLGGRVSYRVDKVLMSDRPDHILVMKTDDFYPDTVVSSMIGQPVERICRHPAIMDCGVTVIGVSQFAMGGLRLTLDHPDGFMAETS